MSEVAATPFFLHEAVLTLYLSDRTGEKLTSANPVYAGALANRVTFESSYEERKFFSSGDAHPRTQQLDEHHTIDVERTWFVRKATGLPFELRRNQRYVLEIVWYDRRFRTWHRRVYYGVTTGRLPRTSDGTKHFVERQRFEAETVVVSGGDGTPEAAAPAASSGGTQVVLFARETPLITGAYLSGTYAWSTIARGVRATIHAKAPQVAACEVTLEINGSLTEFTLTLPTGAQGADVDDEVDLTGLEIPPNALVNWKVTQAPLAETSAYEVTVEMTLEVES